MPGFGISDEGFTIKGFDVILAEAMDRAKQMFGDTVDLTATSPIRKMLEISTAEYAEIWKPMPKIVFSRTLADVEWNTRVVGEDVAGEVARLNAQPDTHHILFGGADIASTFVTLDLVDEFRLFVHPVALGGGTPLFPALQETLNLTLVQARTFDSAVVHLRYRRAGQ